MFGCVCFYSIDSAMSAANLMYPAPSFSEMFGYIAGQLVTYSSVALFSLIGLGVAHNWLKNLK